MTRARPRARPATTVDDGAGTRARGRSSVPARGALLAGALVASAGSMPGGASADEPRDAWPPVRVASEIRGASDEASAEGLCSAASDTWITTKVKVRLMAEPGLSPFSIDVDTRNGVVTLFGSVGSEEVRARAEAEASKVSGVEAVENELQVVADRSAEPQVRDDRTVRLRVVERLSGSLDLSDADIDVAVESGVVRLTGTVANEGDRLRALTLASGAEGVHSVIDGLQVGERTRTLGGVTATLWGDPARSDPCVSSISNGMEPTLHSRSA